MATTSSTPGAGCPLNMEDVLEVLLLCFEAAADAMDPFPFAYVKSVPNTPTGIPSFVLWTTHDLANSPPSADELSSFSFAPASLPTALARLNMCDYFAILLFDEVEKKMQGYFGAQVDWVLTCPVPTLGLFPQDEERFMPAWHSVLEITESNGTVSVMDGTPEQFHWARSTWFLPFMQFAARTTGPRQFNTNARRRIIEDIMQRNNMVYWVVAQERMEALLADLVWIRLFVLPREKRVAEVKEQAEAAFAGAWEEACLRYRG